MVRVHAADVQDRQGVRPLLQEVGAKWTSVSRVCFDGAYSGQLLLWMKEELGLQGEVVRRLGGWADAAVPTTTARANNADFSVLPRRWVVERTFAWLGRYRRLARDYEATLEASEAMIWFASLSLMTRRLAA